MLKCWWCIHQNSWCFSHVLSKDNILVAWAKEPWQLNFCFEDKLEESKSNIVCNNIFPKLEIKIWLSLVLLDENGDVTERSMTCDIVASFCTHKYLISYTGVLEAKKLYSIRFCNAWMHREYSFVVCVGVCVGEKWVLIIKLAGCLC